MRQLASTVPLVKCMQRGHFQFEFELHFHTKRQSSEIFYQFPIHSLYNPTKISEFRCSVVQLLSIENGVRRVQIG